MTALCPLSCVLLHMQTNSPYLQGPQRIQLAFENVDSFILTELPPFNVVSDSLRFLAMTKHWSALQQCRLDARAANLLADAQDYREIRKRAIEFRILTIVPSAEDILIRKFVSVSEFSVAASHFVRGTSDFVVLRGKIINYDRPDEDIADLRLMMENTIYVLQSAERDDFEVVSECVRLQRQLRCYWDAVFNRVP